MNNLDALQAENAPRNDALCRRLAPWLEPWWRFGLYGAGYAWVAGMVATGVVVGAGLLGVRYIAARPLPDWFAMPVLAAGAVVFATAWIPFVRWARKRRAAACRFFELGAILPGTVGPVTRTSGRYGPYVAATLAFEVGGERKRASVRVPGPAPAFVENAQYRVLAAPGAEHCMVFIVPGDPFVERVF